MTLPKKIDIVHIDNFSTETMQKLEAYKAKSIVTLLSDEENFKICEFAYKEYGTSELVVRLHHRFNFKRFSDLGALIVYPDTAIVSLLDHLVRSPMAATLFLGMDPNQETAWIDKGAFIIGAAVASLSWQTLLAGLGGLGKEHLSERFQRLAVIAGNLIILLLGLLILVRAVSK